MFQALIGELVVWHLKGGMFRRFMNGSYFYKPVASLLLRQNLVFITRERFWSCCSPNHAIK